MPEHDEYIDLAQQLHKALDNVLALFVATHGYDYNCVDEAFRALEASGKLLPNTTITVALAERIRQYQAK